MAFVNNLLFCEERLADVVHDCEERILQDVESWEQNRILAASEADLIKYIVDRYSYNPPQLLRDQVCIENQGEVNIDVSRDPFRDVRDRSRPLYLPGFYVNVAIPFEGDGDLFRYQASTYSLNPPEGRISGSTVLICFQGTDLDTEGNRENIDTWSDQIEEHLNWTKNDCENWNSHIQPLAEHLIRSRKQRLLKQANMLSALGLPLKRRPEPVSAIAVPIIRKKRPIALLQRLK